MQPHLRASDADRDHTLRTLQHHTAAGRLTLDEFTTRADAVYRATTHADLAALTADLPAELTHRHAPPVPALAAALIAAVLLVVLFGAAAALVGPAGWDHMHAMMTSMNTVMGGGCGPQPPSP